MLVSQAIRANNNNIFNVILYVEYGERVKYIHTLLLFNEGRDIVFKRPSTTESIL